MENVFYEKAISILNSNYSVIKNLLAEGKNEVALFLYSSVRVKLEFMLELRLIEFDEFLRLTAVHNVFFDDNFLGQ